MLFALENSLTWMVEVAALLPMSWKECSVGVSAWLFQSAEVGFGFGFCLFLPRGGV